MVTLDEKNVIYFAVIIEHFEFGCARNVRDVFEEFENPSIIISCIKL